MSRTLLFALYVALALGRLVVRLPDWQNNQTIWTSAMFSDMDSPWALTNGAHANHDAEGPSWILVQLPIPSWLSDVERQPYIDGEFNLSNALFDQKRYQESLTVYLDACGKAPGRCKDLTERFPWLKHTR